MSRREARESQKGFTLVEVAIALAIASIVAMLAVPSFISIMPRLQLNSNTLTLANEIALARASAIAKSRNFGVSFNVGSNSYSLGTLTPSGPDTWAFNSFATSTPSNNVSLYKAATWDPAPAPDGTETNADLLAIRAVGTLGEIDAADEMNLLDFDQTWRIYLRTTDDAYRKRVVAKPAGRIYVERWQGSTWVED